MNWGKGIIVAFVLFVGVIFTMVFISVNTEFSLVADNYYEQEINYESQLQRIRNFNALNAKPEFDFDRNAHLISLVFDPELAASIKDGEVIFFRSSGAKFDKNFDLALDEESVFKVDTKSFIKGAWTLQLKWSDEGQEYYKEIKFVI